MIGPDPDDPTDAEPMPRWVKGFVVAAVVIVLLVVALRVIGGVEHGPSRHLPGGGDAPVDEPAVHTPPVDRG